MKKNILITIFASIVLIIAITSILTYINRPRIGHEYFKLEPVEWVEPDPATENIDDIEINIFKATRGKAQYEGAQLDLYTDDNLYSFFYHGFYEGEHFRTYSLDKGFYNLTEQEKNNQLDQHTRMKISKNMVPSDNIPEVFFIFKVENKKPEAYIFLDEDWKNKFPNTNIIYGTDFKDESTLTELPFTFEKYKEGIYVDKVNTNINFLLESVIHGGIAVGPITKTELSQLFNGKELSLTFAYMR